MGCSAIGEKKLRTNEVHLTTTVFWVKLLIHGALETLNYHSVVVTLRHTGAVFYSLFDAAETLPSQPLWYRRPLLKLNRKHTN
jgi:hypothetical protein